MATQKTFNALRELSTCEISDALIKLGLTTGGFIPDLHIFSPRQTESLKVVGPAFTVQMVAENVKRDEEPPKTKEHFVFANYHTTLGQKSFVRPSALSVPVDMSPLSYSSPEVTQLYDPAFDYKISVNPGDIIVGDEDGCVAIPPELVEQVVEKAVTGREVDDNVKKDLEAGKGVKESMAKWRGGGGKGESGKP
ncbi:hypothetical protein B9479_003333 [Cryptococcus floricola]|uniref:4-hydroxy-4-methyl-2-oxoglutarate aldolase n=1 Tax=Cryptococcus floricola TaxID=2591691 RepID=A0A5D3AYS9_9TREE|nr:hypothetical protein B9479_003333 [Cryptococcus floricola]